MKKIIMLTLAASLLSGCFEKSKIVDVPDAENQLITTDGRYFVTGANGIYEVVKTDSGFTKKQFGPDCTYSGIAQYKNYLLANCTEPKLINAQKIMVYGKLESGALPEMNTLADLSELSIPNGLTIKAEGEILIANSNYFGAGSISRLMIEETDEGLLERSLEVNYLDAKHNVNGANGVRVLGDTLYFTDFDPSTIRSRIGRLTFNDAGEPGEVEILRDEVSILDDLWPMCEGIVVADYLGGRLIYINNQGEEYTSSKYEFSGTSSVIPAVNAFGSENQLLITEKGILLETQSRIGNQVTRVTIEEDIFSHIGAACH